MVNLDNIKSLVILGDTHTGKTNLAVYLLRSYEGSRTIYTVGYPRKIDNFENLSSFQDLFAITNSIIFVDELQKFIKAYDRKANYELMELISLFEHQGNTIIFTTQLSQFVTKGVEGFIDCWCLTRILDLGNLKNGCKVKRIIQNTLHPKCSRWSLSIDTGEYLEFSEKNPIGGNGVKKFGFANIGKDWKVKPKTANKIPNKSNLKPQPKTANKTIKEVISDENPEQDSDTGIELLQGA